MSPGRAAGRYKDLRFWVAPLQLLNQLVDFHINLKKCGWFPSRLRIPISWAMLSSSYTVTRSSQISLANRSRIRRTAECSRCGRSARSQTRTSLMLSLQAFIWSPKNFPVLFRGYRHVGGAIHVDMIPGPCASGIAVPTPKILAAIAREDGDLGATASWYQSRR